LKFYANVHNAVYVVIPANRVIDPTTLHQTSTRGLRAQFFQHMFDSVAASELHGWTEDERKKVENYLMAHKDLGVRLYLADERDQKIVENGGEIATARCVVFLPTEDGSTQCEHPALAGSNFCRDHIETVEAVV
jgi:hypothetical protein